LLVNHHHHPRKLDFWFLEMVQWYFSWQDMTRWLYGPCIAWLVV
jgi:hypothetical protein